MMRDENFAKPKGFICAITLGAISPKSSSTKVTITVLTTKSSWPNVNTVSIIFAVTITMQILTKLLITNIVASSRSILLSSSRVVEAVELFSPLSLLMSLWLSEKNAVSEPETVAEIISSTSATTQSIITEEGEKSLRVI